MNKPAWCFGTISLLLGGLCLFLLMRPPSAECAQAELKAPPDDVLQAQLAQLRGERDRLETVVDSLRAAPDNTLAPKPPANGAALVPPPMAAMRFETSERHRRMSTRLRNGKIFRQLGLSESQIESLLDVLVAYESRASAAASSGALPIGVDPELRARKRAEVAAVIGPERAEQLEAWQSQSQARFELRRMRDQLEESGEPLSDAQQSRIQELVQARPLAPPPMREKDETPEAFSGRFKTWRNDNREQLRKQVSEVLEPRQLERYDEMDEMAREFEKSIPARAMPAFQTPPPIAGQAASAPRL